MRIEMTDISGLAILHWQVHEDERGRFARAFCRTELAESGFAFDVVQANVSRSTVPLTLRGLHFQHPPHSEAKIVTCSRGRIWDVAVDMRRDSPTYRQWRGFELTPESRCGLHVPVGFAHGFLTLEPESEIHYLVDGAYAPQVAAGVRWNDPALDIAWPAYPRLISERDKNLPLLDMSR